MSRHLATAGLTVFLGSLLAAGQVEGASWRNGERFDPGVSMTRRAAGAPEQLDLVTGYLGQWDVDVVTFEDGEEPASSKGHAEISLINRGHALMESFFSEERAGSDYASVFFLGFNPGSERWFLGGADSATERAWVADGGFADDPGGGQLVVTDTQRRSGGLSRTEVRYSFAQAGRDTLSISIEESTDGGNTWSKTEKRSYRRREATGEFLKPLSTYGLPHPDRPDEAGGFDFLIGEWNASHQMTFPNGQQAQWMALSTAVFALNGSAVLEYNSFDVDPSLPDAATTILRIYNRAMGRWECLFVPNRGHTILYFGGRQEGEEIVLGNFETHSAAVPIAHYVFHSIGDDSYSWYSEQSFDRGTTWTKNWIIDVERKPPTSPGPRIVE